MNHKEENKKTPNSCPFDFLKELQALSLFVFFFVGSFGLLDTKVRKKEQHRILHKTQ